MPEDPCNVIFHVWYWIEYLTSDLTKQRIRKELLKGIDKLKRIMVESLIDRMVGRQDV
jgi:hypothetical protein